MKTSKSSWNTHSALSDRPGPGDGQGTDRRPPTGTFLDALRDNVAREPDGLVYRFLAHDGDELESLTNADLVGLVGRYAGAIRAMHASSRERPSKIVLVLPQGKAFVAAFYGCIAAQAIAVPTFPPKNPSQAQRLKHVLLDLQDCTVLADRECLHTDLADLRRDDTLSRVQWMDIEALAHAPPHPLDDFDAQADAIAMLQYTSGATGTPRGVMVSNRNLVENSGVIRQSFGHDRPHRRGVIWLPPHHDMGLIGGVLQPMYSGFPVLLMPTSLFVRHPLRWLKAISEFRATTSGGPNFAFQMCVDNVRDRDLARLDLSSWDVAFCGAEPISHETMVAFSRRFSAAGFRPSALFPCYGMAETTLMVSGKHHLEDMRALSVDAHALAKGLVVPAPYGTPGTRQLVSCGSVHPSLDLRVVDPQLGTERAEREIGELWVSGPSITQGYRNHREKTLQTYNQRLAGFDGRYLRTGDLGFIDNGELYVTGRIKEVLIIRGANHYPQDIEQECLSACPEFVNCRVAAFSVPTAAHEQMAIVLEVPRMPIEHDAVAKRINARLVEAHGIRADIVIFVPRRTIKTTTSGKLQRLMLRADYLAGSLQSDHVWRDAAEESRAARPRHHFSANSVDEILQWIIDRIATITRLEPSRIHQDDRFADLALDSVRSLEIMSELDHHLGIGVASEVLYKHNTPHLLAHEIFKMSQSARHAVQEQAHAAP